MPEAAAPTSRRRARLAYVVHTLNPGGTERLAVDMALAFRESFDVRVFCLDEPGTWASELRDGGVAVHCLWRQPGLDLTVAVRLARWLREWDADIVHAHQCTPWFYAALSRLFNAKPRLLLEEHGRFHPEIPNAKRAAVNRFLIGPLTHDFIAVSADIRARLERYEGLDSGRISVVYNGLNAPPSIDTATRDRLRAEFGAGPDDFLVGTVGRLDPIKNLPMLVAALAMCAGSKPAVRGVIIGAGPERVGVEALLRSRGLTDSMKMAGFRSDARQAVQALDLFVMTSFSEGTSMALLEAMSNATPVAVTAVGGNPEIVTDDVNGLLVPSDDAARLADAIRALAADAPRRKRLALQGQKDFETRFAFGRMIDAYATRYQTLLTGRSLTLPRSVAVQ